MKYALVIFTAVLLSGCGDSYETERRPGYSSTDYRLTCIDGVTYIKYGTGGKGSVTVKFDKDSKVVPCN